MENKGNVLFLLASTRSHLHDGANLTSAWTSQLSLNPVEIHLNYINQRSGMFVDVLTVIFHRQGDLNGLYEPSRLMRHVCLCLEVGHEYKKYKLRDMSQYPPSFSAQALMIFLCHCQENGWTFNKRTGKNEALSSKRLVSVRSDWVTDT